MNSLKHPKLDFTSLQAAVDQVRQDDRQRDASVDGELTAVAPKTRRDPLRARYPNFRWRLIPAVYCAFHGALCIGGLVTYDLSGNASFAGYRQAVIAMAHMLLFSCAAVCWFKNYWKCGIVFWVAVIVLNDWLY